MNQKKFFISFFCFIYIKYNINNYSNSYFKIKKHINLTKYIYIKIIL